jgi:protocatechuate 3,4-dioxygenase beta subunit
MIPWKNSPDSDLEGLVDDLRALTRRQSLQLLLAGGSFAAMSACEGRGGLAPTGTAPVPAGDAAPDTCVAFATETNGPFPADGSNSANGSVANMLITSGIIRSDIRPSFAGLSGTAPGVDMDLTMTLVDTRNNCAALAGHAIYLWHCDAAGAYSIYNVPDQNYLRGVAITDADGRARFTSIFPGCYRGRYPHLHFEVYRSQAEATTYANRLLTSQIALPEAACADVYNRGGDYAASIQPYSGVSLATDGIFADNSAAQLRAMTAAASRRDDGGYTAAVTIGLAV